MQTCDITNIVRSPWPMMCPFNLKLHFTETLKVLSCHAHAFITTACQVCNSDVDNSFLSKVLLVGFRLCILHFIKSGCLHANPQNSDYCISVLFCSCYAF